MATQDAMATFFTMATEEDFYQDEMVTGDSQTALPATDGDLEGDKERTEQCRIFNFSFSSCLMGLVVVVGLIGNILCLIVLKRLRQTSTERSMSLLLSLLSIYDFIYLASLGLMTIVPTACSFFSACPSFFDIYLYLILWMWPVVGLFHTQSTWAMVLVAFQRFVAVCIPHRLTVLCSTRKTRIYALVSFVAVTLFELPVFLNDYVEEKWDAEKNKTILVKVYTDMGKSDAYQMTYKTILSYIFHYLLPLLLLGIFTGFLILSLHRSLRMHKESMANHQGKAADYDSLTLMLVVTVLIYFITQPWEPIRRILEHVYDGQPGCGHAYFYVTPVGNVLGAVNSACNFYVFCTFSRRMRALARVVLCGCTGKAGEKYETGQQATGGTGSVLSGAMEMNDDLPVQGHM